MNPRGCRSSREEQHFRHKRGPSVAIRTVSHAHSGPSCSTCDHPFRRVRNGNRAARASLSSKCTSTESAVLSPLSASGAEFADTAVVMMGTGASVTAHALLIAGCTNLKA